MLRGKRRGWRLRVLIGQSGQPGTVDDGLTEFLDRDPLVRVTFEDASQDQVQIERDGQNGAQELGILQERAESGILGRGLFPGITPTGQVDQNDAEAPYIVGRSGITTMCSRRWLLTFYASG